MNRTRTMLGVYVDLDPVPGAFHTADSARNHVSHMIKQQIPHYSPVVGIISYGRQMYNIHFDHNNPNYIGNGEANIMFVKTCLNHANDMLAARGYLFLNELYALLGFPLTREGQLVGWTEDPVSWDPQYMEGGNVNIAFFTEGVIIDKAFEEQD